MAFGALLILIMTEAKFLHRLATVNEDGRGPYFPRAPFTALRLSEEARSEDDLHARLATRFGDRLLDGVDDHLGMHHHREGAILVVHQDDLGVMRVADYVTAKRVIGVSLTGKGNPGKDGIPERALRGSGRVFPGLKL